MNKIEEECSVCYEILTKKDKVIKECGHRIHKLCILKSGKNKCPICRCDIKFNKKDINKCKEYNIKMELNECKLNNPILNGFNDKDLLDILQYVSMI